MSRAISDDGTDWALIVPIPASVAANRAVLSAEFGESVSLVHCLQSILVTGRTADAVVAVVEELHAEVAELLTARGVSVTVVAVAGQGGRARCLAAGLAALSPTIQHVLVHDIYRPLASTDLVDRILDGLRRGDDAVVPALTMVDSVKTVDAAGTVTETVDRTLLRSAQFPRGFQRQHLTTMLATNDDDDVDDLVMARRVGVAVTVIEGDPDAFALDIPRDIALADARYAYRLAEQR